MFSLLLTFNTISIEQEVRLDLTPPESSQIQLQLGQQSLLDVGDDDGFGSVDEDRLDDAASDVNQELSGQRGQQFGGQLLGGGGSLRAAAGAVHQLLVHHDELGVDEFQSAEESLD